MGVKVKGIKQVTRNVYRTIDNIQDRKIVRALTSAMVMGAGQAEIYTPIDTSVLINSQFREIIVTGTRITGRVGYTANYAVYVHDPNVKQKFRRATAQKEFLTKGFEDTASLIRATVEQEMSL